MGVSYESDKAMALNIRLEMYANVQKDGNKQKDIKIDIMSY